jgi:hypothetical protein
VRSTLRPTAATRLGEQRFELLNGAVAGGDSGARVYLDGPTRPGWRWATSRCGSSARGSSGPTGFFVNLSNYRFTEQVAKYGTWIS